MLKDSYLTLRISGETSSGEALSVETYDINELAEKLKTIRTFIDPENTQNTVALARVEEGSIWLKFVMSASLALSLRGNIEYLRSEQALDDLSLKRIQAIEKLQSEAIQKKHTFEFMLKTDKKTVFKINSETKYLRKKQVWTESEFYLYGEVVGIGGKSKPVIRMDEETYGMLVITVSSRTELRELGTNILYQTCGVRVKGKQNLHTGELDKTSLVFVEVQAYKTTFDEAAFEEQVKKATASSWKDVNDTDEWLKEIRG